jgi:PilZ domain
VIHAKIAIDTSQEHRRRESRAPVAAEIPLRQLGDSAVDARLVNISSRGFMAETKAEIEAGSRIWLILPGPGRVNALVVWARSGRIGGEFSAPIDPLSVFEALGHADG